MKFLWTTITVKNLDESIAFYTDLLELKVLQRMSAGPHIEIVFMGNGVDNETQVELLADKNNTAVNFSEFISIGFAVESVDVMLETVRTKNIPVHNGPIETPGAKFFIVKDPNGLNVQLFEQK